MSLLRVSEVQARLLTELRKAAPQIRCALIGAVAVGHHLPLQRWTGDADLALEALRLNNSRAVARKAPPRRRQS